MQKISPENKRVNWSMLFALSGGQEEDEEKTYHSMNPPRWDDHCVSFHQLNLEDLIDHVSQPGLVLQFTSRPLFIRGKVCWRGPDKIKYLENKNNIIYSPEENYSYLYF